MQMVGDIFSISEGLRNIIQENIKKQAHHIQALLANELNKCKRKGNYLVDKNIKTI